MRRAAQWVLSLSALLAPACLASAAPAPASIAADPPRDALHPAAMHYVRVPSGGSLMNGVLYTPSGAGPHPVVLLLHGFPGNEQNLDLAQAMRRAGFAVLTLHYRGAWGSPGAFSFAHAVEDADAAVDFLRDPNNVRGYALDPTRVFVAGHSMGGFMAASAAAHRPAITGLILISAWNIGADGQTFTDARARAQALHGEFADDVIPLAGTTADALMDEARDHSAGLNFIGYAAAIASRPVLIVTAADGSYAQGHRLATAVRQSGGHDVTETAMATDHPFSDHRIALATALVEWLTRHGAIGPLPTGAVAP